MDRDIADNDSVTAIEVAPVGVPQVGMRSYLSSQHLWSARHLADLAAEVEAERGRVPRFSIRQRAYVASSIFASVAFMEAAVNELIKDVVDNHGSYTAPLSADARTLLTTFWQEREAIKKFVSIQCKYQKVLTACNRSPFDKGALPYQNANLVIELRNELTHFKPETYSRGVQHKLGEKLRNKFPENPLMKGSDNPFFPDKCLGSDCARWAHGSAGKFVDQFAEKLGVQLNYQLSSFSDE